MKNPNDQGMNLNKGERKNVTLGISCDHTEKNVNKKIPSVCFLIVSVTALVYRFAMESYICKRPNKLTWEVVRLGGPIQSFN